MAGMIRVDVFDRPGAAVVVLLSAALAMAAPASAETIRTIAGSGRTGHNRDAGPALEVNIDQPFGVELGPDGALYVCDAGTDRVWRLDLKTRELKSVAGSGKKGYAGDGGPATNAQLNEPYEVRFDFKGDLYFVEMRNHVVRRVETASGMISTVAGTGKPGYGGDGGPAVEAQLRDPHSIAFDRQGRLYIADIGNHRIRRVDMKTGLIESIAGNGDKKLPRDAATAHGEPILGPRALYAAKGQLWIALREGNSVWRLDLELGTLHHVAGTGDRGFAGGGGPANMARFDGPKGIAVAENGLVYVVDTENEVIREIDPQRGTIRTVAGVGPEARGFAGDGGPATQAHFDRPHGICIAPDGSLYVGDTNNHRVRLIEP